MKKRTSLLLALSLLFAVGITSCSNDGDKGPPAKNKPVEEITTDEALSICEYFVTTENKTMKSVASDACLMEGVMTAALTIMSTPNISDDDLANICSEEQTKCLQDINEDLNAPPADSCEEMPLSHFQGCSITVNDIVQCHKAILDLEAEAVKKQMADVPKCSQITSEWLQTAINNYSSTTIESPNTAIPPACETFATQCPTLFNSFITDDWDNNDANNGNNNGDDWGDIWGDDWNDDWNDG